MHTAGTRKFVMSVSVRIHKDTLGYPGYHALLYTDRRGHLSLVDYMDPLVNLSASILTTNSSIFHIIYYCNLEQHTNHENDTKYYDLYINNKFTVAVFFNKRC